MQGRRLAFIGYLPCKAGDWVYTDGSVIFGNSKPKGAPVIFDEPSGVPVLGDNIRGYFTTRGKFKPYRVIGENWIVNNDKKFSHDDSAENIIDADIYDDGDVITVTDAFYQKSETLDLVYVALQLKDSRYWGSADYAYTPIHKLAREQTLGIENLSDENVPANLLINGSHKKTLSLEKYAKDAENRALSCAAEIMTLSFEDDDIYPYTSYAGEEYKEYVYMDEYRYHTVSYRPEQPFIAHSVAYILASNTANKSFGGVVFASAYGFCFPHIKSRLKKADKFLREWKCIPFGVSCLYEISDNDKLEPFAFRTFGGVDCEVTVLGDTLWLCDTVFGEYAGGVATLLSSRHLELKSSSPPQEWEKLIPVGTGFYRMNKFGLLTFYNSKEVLVAENIPVYDDFLYIEMDSSFFQEERIIYFLNDKPNMQCKEYTPDGTIETLLLGEIGDYTVQVIKDDEGHVIGYENERYEVASEKPILDGYYRKIDEKTSKPLNFTPLFYEFKDGSYLCGVKDGKLYKVDRNGKTVLIGEGIKNFRLNELKKLSKAKK